MKKKHLSWLLLLAVPVVCAKSVTVTMHTTENNTPIGTIILEDTPYGVLITPRLTSLNPGLHGFHIHAEGSCEDHAQAAGGHFDPAESGKHLGPYRAGHLGDLPVLYVDAAGSAAVPVLAPRLSVAQVSQRAVMIHQGGDNYQDQPRPLGGGGERVACGVIPKIDA